jgi:hypothetical protein
VSLWGRAAMADYYPVLARAVSILPNNNARARRDLYERARAILIERLSNDPDGLAAKTAQELAALDTAIRRVEAETPPASTRPATSSAPTRPPTNRAPTAHADAQTKVASDIGAGGNWTMYANEELGGELNSLGAMLLGIANISGAVAFTGVIYLRGLLWVENGDIAYPVLLAATAFVLCLLMAGPWLMFRLMRGASRLRIHRRGASGRPANRTTASSSCDIFRRNAAPTAGLALSRPIALP